MAGTGRRCFEHTGRFAIHDGRLLVTQWDFAADREQLLGLPAWLLDTVEELVAAEMSAG